MTAVWAGALALALGWGWWTVSGAGRGGADPIGPGFWNRLEDKSQRQAWDRLARAPTTEKDRLAEEFLQRFPSSPLAPLAHYQLATAAFDGQRYDRFVKHAELALAGFQGVLEFAPSQRLRQLQLLGQLSFLYAETGRPDLAELHARHLLEALEREPHPENLTPLQWATYRRHAAASGHYVLGRAALSRAAGQGNSAASDPAAWLEKAEQALRRSVDLNPADGYSALRLALVWEAQGRMSDARDSYARAALLPGPASRPAREKLHQLSDGAEASAGPGPTLQRVREQLLESLREHPRALLLDPGTGPHPVFWWDGVPEEVRRGALRPPFSNIRFEDYAGPEACRGCHEDKYSAWRQHSHSRMNAWATPENVLGDFSGQARIEYQGGSASFVRRGDVFLMRLERGRLRRTYRVVRTIGSRFFQYYVGRQVEGPEERSEPIWREDHVLPFGYWLDQRQWVPVVHINEEVPDDRRWDFFGQASRVVYDRNCSPCHTTRPFGDWLMTTDGRLRSGAFRPRDFSFDLFEYVSRSHPEEFPQAKQPLDFSLAELEQWLDEKANGLPAKDYAVVLGVSCEACHNGALEHVRRSEERATSQRPLFFPAGEEIIIPAAGQEPDQVWGRRPENLNWICSRCHSGGRPQFAAGIDTWNSTEYSDAASGACYTGRTPEGLGPLTCTHCHDPHRTIGKAWSRSPRLDDARCLACHLSLRRPEARARHTRHPAQSEGDRCMNCHMPRLNEGLQQMVRTHHIFSPTEAAMLESNQPNACNLCHLEKSVGWTLDHLEVWYGEEFDREEIAAATGDLARPAALGWLASSHEATRLVAAEALGRSRARWALPQLIEMLDDPYLINRQFTQKRLEEMLDVSLAEQFGYRFYQSRQQRRKPLKALRRAMEKAGQ